MKSTIRGIAYFLGVFALAATLGCAASASTLSTLTTF